MKQSKNKCKNVIKKKKGILEIKIMIAKIKHIYLKGCNVKVRKLRK